MKQKLSKTKITNQSVYFRLNCTLLSAADIIAAIVESRFSGQLTSLVHNFNKNFLYGSNNLIVSTFERYASHLS